MRTVTVEAVPLSVIGGRHPTCATIDDQSDASTLDGSTLRPACASGSESVQSTDSSAISAEGDVVQQTERSHEANGSRKSSNTLLQFLTKTWLGNFIATAALLVAIAGLGLTAYSSLLQAIAAKWTMRNDAFQSCLSVSSLNMSSRYCDGLLSDGFEAPPGILRKRWNPSELRRTDSTSGQLGFLSALFFGNFSGPIGLVWHYVLLIVGTTACILPIILGVQYYSRRRRGRVVTSLARLPTLRWTRAHLATFLDCIADSTLLCTLMGTDSHISDSHQSAGSECSDESEASPTWTKIGVSYYSEDDNSDTGEDTEDELQLPHNIDHMLDLDYSEFLQGKATPQDMSLWFAAEAQNLREAIMDTTTTCKIFDTSGAEIPPQVSDSFCAKSDLHEVIKQQKGFIKRLYVEAKRAQMSANNLDATTEQSRVIYDASLAADAFYAGVIRSLKAFAILISMRTSPTSEIWYRFEADCLQVDDSKAAFRDELLPFDLETARLRLGPDYECFYSRQWHFCALELSLGHVMELSLPDECLRLPLLRKETIDTHSSGQVYRVRVRGSHLSYDNQDATFIMGRTSDESIIPATDRCNPGTAISHECIRMPQSLLITSRSLYTFLDVGPCNLRQYMALESGPATPLKLHLESHLRLIAGIADALRYLHSDLIAKSGDPLEYVHLNVNTENIIVKGTNERTIFQLADFGVSKFGPRSLHPKLLSQSSNLPPEAGTYDELTTAADVWAFGTVYAEYVAWLSGGWRSFEQAKSHNCDGRSATHARFFEPHPVTQSPTLKRAIEHWFIGLLASTSELHPLHEAPTKFYSNSWWLLEDRLLVCNPQRRANMAEICVALEKKRMSDCRYEHADRKTPHTRPKDVPQPKAGLSAFGSSQGLTNKPHSRTPEHEAWEDPWSERASITLSESRARVPYLSGKGYFHSEEYASSLRAQIIGP